MRCPRLPAGRSGGDAPGVDHPKVGFVSLTEAPGLTTPSGRVLVELLVVFAEFERVIPRRRVAAGIARAHGARGTARPPVCGLRCFRGRSSRPRGQHLSQSDVARRLGIGRSSVRRGSAEKG
jgi:DNA invertase Pin-like site-specific DNA recombinase